MVVCRSSAPGRIRSECDPKVITPPNGPIVAVSEAATVSAAHTKSWLDGGGDSRFERTAGDVTLLRSSRQPVRNHAVAAAPASTAPKRRLRFSVIVDIGDSWRES